MATIHPNSPAESSRLSSQKQVLLATGARQAASQGFIRSPGNDRNRVSRLGMYSPA